MTAPADLGRAAARRLRSGLNDVGVVEVEGPRRYSFNDVGAAFATVLGRPVEVRPVPREGVEGAFRELGFSEPAAKAYARMTEATIDAELPSPDAVERGSVTLEDYLREMIARR